MKDIINKLSSHNTLSKDEAKEVLLNISKGKYNNSHISSFLTIFMMRNITLEELQGFKEALLELCIKIDLSDYNTIDLCGTGGDNKDTFNISTLSAFVTAGAKVNVSKHGNYGVSSSCGSSNVLEFLGIKFSNNKDFLKKSIEKSGICILHAPLFHPAMKNVAPIRKELGLKTFFNILGPLVNPSFPKNQIVGVFNLELARLYSYLFQKTNKNYAIIHSLDGYDEISLTGNVKIITRNEENIFSPQDLSLQKLNSKSINGGETIKESAKIFMNILQNKGTKSQNQVIFANAGLAISTALNISIEDGIEKAKEALKSNKAFEAFNKLKNLSE
ncbi:MAG: anthranilate phosphoribosyltransferase [Flavobacteriaceae bacterium]|jgi:anthranilate phosphoribosyltransferase|nr:anthranilate phosphoribosyltransferase [Flavobacteriaceae bacterium]MBT4298339.1 anthranilate phosphoribosyltransferase [Flavobacteriaceae bacterium]MBT5232784.1 anthranilate phosphoribosyltransferase [Flavobacteriaceae bacterium]MBT5492976.1 anthranilate phosphoribosyltransferase [Flavobacteriaceae bacterium]MBT6653830.1 anthranilate phosphoribosyltransferase [Flavobacteriaceae bacterium]|tara:strand:- start:4285 stop:5277 length:993 start_codon:yes stop_codon:yes gene_type:complete